MADEVKSPLPAEAPIDPVIESKTLVDKATAAAERMESAAKRLEDANIKAEANIARMIVGGRSEAGAIKKTPEQEKTEKEDQEVKDTVKKYLGR